MTRSALLTLALLGAGGAPAPAPHEPAARPLEGRELARHVLERVTYGATEADLAAVEARGVDAFVAGQLRPDGIPESPVLLAKLAALPPPRTPVGDPNWVWQHLWAEYPLRARYTTRQLNEVMTDFWLNHFDTALFYGNDAGVVGEFASLDLDPEGRPAIGFLWNGKAMAALRDGSGWTTREVDPAYALHVSLRVSPATGRPAVSFYEVAAGHGDANLRLATFDGSAWTSEVVDAEGDVGAWSALAFTRAGSPVVAYHDATRGALRLARREEGGWELETVAPGGLFAALALDAAGAPHVAHWDPGRESVVVSSRRDDGWTTAVVARVPASALELDRAPAPLRPLALALDPRSGRPAVAWHDPLGRDLRLSSWDGKGWVTETVDAAGEAGLAPSLAFDARTGEPVVAYHERREFDARLARRRGGAWTAETVAAGREITGLWCSLALDRDGRAQVAWHNGSLFSLQLAREREGGGFDVATVASQGVVQRTHTLWQKLAADAFRARALAPFRELLHASAASAAMMSFLNNDVNFAGAGNENYARELLELHTLGVDGGYTQRDVETVARALTGWGNRLALDHCDVETDGFCYHHGRHDGSEKTILGRVFPGDAEPGPASWMRQGREVLDHLAAHPSTARFVCGKLVEKFVADDPRPRLQEECARAWAESGGSVRRLLEVILASPEFRSEGSLLAKVKTPLEYTIGALRHLDGATDGISLYDKIEAQGMAIFFYTVPTGYPERGDYWVGGNSLLHRFQFADWLAHATSGSQVDPATALQAAGIDRADAAADWLLDRLARGDATALERDEVVACLGGDPGPIDLSEPEVEARLRDAVALVLSFPAAMKQ